MAEEAKTDKAKKRAVIFSTGIGAGIGGGAVKLVSEGLKPLEHLAGEGTGRLARLAKKAPHAAGAFIIPAAIAGGVMGAREKRLQLEMAGNPQKRREYMRATGNVPSLAAKTAGIAVPLDSGKLIAGRDSYAQGTEAVELGNVANVQGLLDTAFANKAKMSARAEKQLKSLYPKGATSGHGRARSVGRSASEASGIVARALAAAPKDPSANR